VKDEYDFSDAEQGKFYRPPIGQLDIPRRLDGKSTDITDNSLKSSLKENCFKPLTKKKYISD
jgi:hypothetical protein